MQILPSYNFQYFNESNEMQTKKLNIFDCFLRKAFGMYPETHLSNVISTLYERSLNGEFATITSEKHQNLMELH